LLGFRHGGDPSGVWRRGGARGEEPDLSILKETWCNRRELQQLGHRMADKEKDSERVPNFDGNAGLTFDVYEENILNYTAGKTDDRGWSCADYLTGVDEGGALGPARRER
jgi:hypothetical protein